MQPDEEELELILRSRAGNAEAFRRLVERHYDPCLRFAMGMLRHRADAEDAVQESFVRVWTALPRYRERGRFRGWLYRILSNRCRARLDRRAREDGAPLDQVPPALSSVEAEAERQARPFVRAALERALGALPPDLREAFLLKHGEGLTYAEMSEVTGASVSALKMRVSRARDALRARLERIDDD